MEYSPAKRRKTSPTSGVAVSASKPGNGQLRQEGPQSSGPRKSYMSPTKASISRFNPNLLPQSEYAETERATSRGTHVSSRAQAPGHTSTDPNGVQDRNHSLGATPLHDLPNGGIGAEERGASPDMYDTPSRLPRFTSIRGTRDIVKYKSPMRTPTYKGQRARTGNEAHVDEIEPSLPSTPSQLGLEPPPEKPRGLLFQSPSKNSASGTRTSTQSSPLKPRHHSQPTAPLHDRIVSVLGPRVYVDSAPNVSLKSRLVRNSKHDLSLQQLDARLKALQDDLTIGSMQSRWRKNEPRWGKILTKKGRDVARYSREILNFRANNADKDYSAPSQLGAETERVDRDPGSLNITSRLSRFCPFSKQGPPRVTKSAASLEGGGLPLTIRIPYSVISPGRSGSLAIQQHLEFITPDSTTLARLQISVEPVSQNVEQLKVHSIATWATTELNPWLYQSSVEKTPAMIGSAIGRYMEISEARANCWFKCNTHLPNLIVSRRNLASQTPAFGLRSIHLARSSMKLSIEWNIGINNEGEVESTVSSKCSFPDNWHHFSSQGDLSRIDELFDGLVRDKGIAEAIRIMAEILFPP